MKINNFDLSGKKVFVVAELSANHKQDFSIALKTIDAIKDSGADAVKLQTFKPENLTLNCEKEYFQIKQGTLWDGKTLYNLYKEVYTPWEWHLDLIEYARKIGLVCFSSPFDKNAVDFLEKMNVPAYKIASFEITDIQLIEYTASKGKPMIISTGIATLGDIEEAVNACRKMGNNDISLLKCTSSYPAPIEEANLLTIPHLKDTFKVKVGLSDHTMGHAAAIAAVALGAKIIEKHFILDRKIVGPDSAFSIEPAEFKEMVNAIREVEKALGTVNYDLTEKVEKSRVFSRSLFIVKDVKEGEKVTEENTRSIRPGYGMHPRHLKEVMGKTFRGDFEKGTPLKWGMID